jgi:hypothetical protein
MSKHTSINICQFRDLEHLDFYFFYILIGYKYFIVYKYYYI